jgi:hypothetical protein
MVWAEGALGPCDEATAANTAVFARLLHEQEKFSDAEVLYDLAIDRWKNGPSIPEHRREMVVTSLLRDKAYCRKGLPPGPVPVEYATSETRLGIVIGP